MRVERRGGEVGVLGGRGGERKIWKVEERGGKEGGKK